MLIKFAVTNYRGFSNRIEWNLANPSNYEFNSFAIKNGIIKSGIIYGPNGGGKTNFGLALFDIVNHLSQKWKKPNYYENFPYAGKVSTPVLFEYTFRFGNVLVEYTYSKNRQGVLFQDRRKSSTTLNTTALSEYFDKVAGLNTKERLDCTNLF